MTHPIKDAKCKKCRRAGEKLFIKGDRCNSPKCAMVSRNFPPGMHGAGRYTKLTAYGKQLKEKQKAKRIYGLREKQFRNYFETSLQKDGNTGELLFASLENRLDSTVYRLGLAPSLNAANQLVGHGHIIVNGKKVDIPSYSLKIGEVVSLRDKSKKSTLFTDIEQSLTNKKDTVSWLNMDIKTLEGKVTGMPRLGDAEMSIDWQVIVEFYSR